jgi:hypothetical protein
MRRPATPGSGRPPAGMPCRPRSLLKTGDRPVGDVTLRLGGHRRCETLATRHSKSTAGSRASNLGDEHVVTLCRMGAKLVEATPADLDAIKAAVEPVYRHRAGRRQPGGDREHPAAEGRRDGGHRQLPGRDAGPSVRRRPRRARGHVPDGPERTGARRLAAALRRRRGQTTRTGASSRCGWKAAPSVI